MQKYLKKIVYTSVLVLQIAALVGCGGGSSGGSSGGGSAPSNNNPPAAAPTVEMTSPVATQGVSKSVNISLKFSESVANVNTTTVSLHRGTANGDVVSTSDITSSDNVNFTFSPTDDLDSLTTYVIVVSSGVTSVATGQALVPVNFSFTAGDFTVPVATLVSPSPTTNVSKSTIIQVKFSTPVKNAEVGISLVEGNVNGTNVPITTPQLGGGNIYSFSSKADLKGKTQYYVVIHDNVVAVSSGNPVSQDNNNFSFTTGLVSIPTVAMVRPSNNGSVESLLPNIVFGFSESVSGVNQQNIQLTTESGLVITTSIFTAPAKAYPNTYAFHPTTFLTPESKYYIKFSSGITSSLTGESLVPITYSFSVMAPSFIYVAENDSSSGSGTSKGGIKVCGITAKSRQLTSCTVAYNNDDTYGVTVNPAHTYAYIVRKDHDQVLACSIDRSTGALSNCVSTATTTVLKGPTKLTFNPAGTFAYITNYRGNYLTYCKANSVNGILSECYTSTETVFDKPASIAIDSKNQYAYITNNGTDKGKENVQSCIIESSSGSLKSCVATGSGYDGPFGITLSKDNKYAYTTNKTAIKFCPVESGLFVGSCASAITSTNFTSTSNVELHNYAMYITDETTGILTSCLQDNRTGHGLANICQNSPMTFYKPTGISIMSDR